MHLPEKLGEKGEAMVEVQLSAVCHGRGKGLGGRWFGATLKSFQSTLVGNLGSSGSRYYRQLPSGKLLMESRQVCGTTVFLIVRAQGSGS